MSAVIVVGAGPGVSGSLARLYAAEGWSVGLVGNDEAALADLASTLVGVRVENLRPRAGLTRQLVLGEHPQGWAEADRAVDRATTRFGEAAVRPATLLDGGRP